MSEDSSDALDDQHVEAMLLGTSPPAVPPPSTTPVCRICLDHVVAPGDRLVSPCKCKGTMKYVHASCLNQWRRQSRRSTSAMACDQCGTTYHLRLPRHIRILLWKPMRIALVGIFFVLTVLSIGWVSDFFLQRHSPKLFEGPHPFHLQSVSFVPSKEMPWIATSMDTQNSIPSIWLEMLGLAGDDDEDEAEEEAIDSYSYRLGVFQPVLLVQVVQGVTQRFVEMICGRSLAAPAAYDMGTKFPSLVQRILSIEHVDSLPSEVSSYAMPLTWSEHMLWITTLGLAVLAMSMNFHSLILISSIGAFYVGTPFSVVVVVRGPSVSDNEAVVLWEGANFASIALLGLSLWGLTRTVSSMWRALAFVAHWALMHTDHVVEGYAADRPSDDPPGLPAPLPGPRPASWWRWLVDRVVRGHAAYQLDDPRWAWMLAHAGD